MKNTGKKQLGSKPPQETLNGMGIRWAQIHELPDEMLKEYARMLDQSTSDTWIKNIRTTFKILQVNKTRFFPVCIQNEEWENSFVCSLYTSYVLYAKDEINRNIKHSITQKLLLGVIQLFSILLKKGEINKNVFVNNFLLSTNPYPSWDGKEISAITAFLKIEYPKHAYIFRSLNTYQHQHLLTVFNSNEYTLLGSRQVYIYDTPFESWIKHKNNQHDRRLLKNSKLTYVSHAMMFPYLSQALRLYNSLYLEKYSLHNPQFTIDYFTFMYKTNCIHFQGFINDSKELKAFSGVFVWGDTITSPLVGYDTQAPISEGLYRHAIQSIFMYRFKTNLLLNLSSGAAHFKKIRGGIPSIEYSAVYTKHLILSRRWIYNILCWFTDTVGIPLMKKYEL